MNIFKQIKQSMEVSHLANQVRRERDAVIAAVAVVAKELSLDPVRMMDWPRRPFLLQTDDKKFVFTLNDEGYKNLMIFINKEDAILYGELFTKHTNKLYEVVQPEGLRPFKTECVLTIGDAAFEMWYGTYIAQVMVLENESMKATGLI